jgi:hypothetical protein
MDRTESQPLTRAHAALLEDLHKLEQALSAASPPNMPEFCACLAATRTDVTEHFRAQEQCSFMDTVQRQQPHLEPAIHRLAAEHRELTASLDALLNEVVVSGTLGNGLRGKLTDWIERVRRHEAHEVDFIQDVVDCDIGTKD